jgi:hypothetical protein
MNALIRDYRIKDLRAVKAIHEKTQIDYKFPNIVSPLFLVKKVMEYNGEVVAACGLYIQVECYLWMDPGAWADPETKMAAIELLDKQAMDAAWLKGVDQACLWLPPGMERFGERLTQDLGFTKDRGGWVSYSKPTERCYANHN